MRRLFKVALERAAVGTGLASILLERTRPSVAILAYHNVLPAGSIPAGDQALHIDQDRFSEHLDRLVETHEIVPLSEVLQEPNAGDRPKAVITFDDAYVGALTVGLQEVTVRELPSTVFVAPELLGAEGFWWDVLAPGDGRPLSAAIRRTALGTCAGAQERVLEWAASKDLSRTPMSLHARPADADLLKHAAELPGVTIGSHTLGHPNLSALSLPRCREEISLGHDGVREALGGRGVLIDWLAYPYGMVSEAAVTAAGEVMTGATLVAGGLARRRGRPESHPLRLPRISVPRGLSTEGLSLRLAGLGNS